MKRYLADTHALLWFASGSPKLSRRARRIFEGIGASTEVLVSTVSLWDIALLHDSAAIRLASGFSVWCSAVEDAGIRFEPLRREDVEEARSLPALVDPADRLIAGSALRLGVPLISADRRMAANAGLRIVW